LYFEGHYGAAAETAPYLPSAGVVLVGCAHAPLGLPTPAMAVRWGTRPYQETLVGTLLELPLDDRVAERAIELRRQKKMTVMDAVIAGAALTNRLPLVTR
jgi:predicted nucleic acid-binding protein